MRRISTSDLRYARVLLDLDVPFESARKMHRIFQKEESLAKVLDDPTIPVQERYNIIDKVFDEELRTFLKVCMNNGMISDIRAIYLTFKELYFKEKHYVLAELTYAEELTEKQLDEIRDYLIEKFGCRGVEFEMVCDPEVLGGFIIRVGDYELDKSLRSSLEKLREKIKK